MLPTGGCGRAVQLMLWALLVSLQGAAPTEPLLCAVQRGGGQEECWLLVDSGAGIHACPPSHAPWAPTVKSEVISARTASGAQVHHYGQKTVAYRFQDGSIGQITWEVMDVEKPVLSVGVLNAGGHEVTLARGNAVIRKGAKALRLVEHNEVFYLKAKALQLRHGAHVGLFPFEQGGASASSGPAAPAEEEQGSSEAVERVRPAADGQPAVAPPLPALVGEEEKRRHALTHYPFRSWCAVCVAAKAADPAHRHKPEGAPPTKPLLQADFFYMNRRAERERAVGITLVCVTTGATAGCGLPAKSKGIFVVEFLAAAIAEWGYLDLVLRTDNESSIVAIARAVKEHRKPHQTLLETIPKHSHASLGHAEECNRALEEGTRCIVVNLENHGKIVVSTDILFAWMIRHAAWLRHRFAVHATGRTSYRELKGRDYSGPIVEFGEVVWARDSSPATARAKAEPRWLKRVWLGKTESSEEHILAGAEGGPAFKARAVRRCPIGERFSKRLLDGVKCLPWSPVE